MADTDFPSTVIYLHPSGDALGPAAEQLRTLRLQALREGRQKDADEYERMARHLLERTRGKGGDLPLWKKAAFAALVSVGLVLAIHYLI